MNTDHTSKNIETKNEKPVDSKDENLKKEKEKEKEKETEKKSECRRSPRTKNNEPNKTTPTKNKQICSPFSTLRNSPTNHTNPNERNLENANENTLKEQPKTQTTNEGTASRGIIIMPQNHRVVSPTRVNGFGLVCTCLYPCWHAKTTSHLVLKKHSALSRVVSQEPQDSLRQTEIPGTAKRNDAIYSLYIGVGTRFVPEDRFMREMVANPLTNVIFRSEAPYQSSNSIDSGK